MTEAERKMLAVMRGGSAARASTWGAERYGGDRKPQSYARPAAKVLQRLRVLGYVSRDSERWGTFWTITKAGQEALASGT